MKRKQFYCGVCEHNFESDDFRIVKQASHGYYVAYCPLCGTLIYKLRKEDK